MFEEASHAHGPLQNHRPMCYGHADYERITEIPYQKGAGFSSLPGVHRHEPGAVFCITISMLTPIHLIVYMVPD